MTLLGNAMCVDIVSGKSPLMVVPSTDVVSHMDLLLSAWMPRQLCFFFFFFFWILGAGSTGPDEGAEEAPNGTPHES